jgi:hypothetical protein
MSLRDTDQIDVIVDSPHTDGFDLLIVESGDIDDPIERYVLMVEKLSNYAQYVLGGQLFEHSPEAEGKTIRFCVISTTEPNEAMRKVDTIKSREDPSVRFPVVF